MKKQTALVLLFTLISQPLFINNSSAAVETGYSSSDNSGYVQEDTGFTGTFTNATGNGQAGGMTDSRFTDASGDLYESEVNQIGEAANGNSGVIEIDMSYPEELPRDQDSVTGGNPRGYEVAGSTITTKVTAPTSPTPPTAPAAPTPPTPPALGAARTNHPDTTSTVKYSICDTQTDIPVIECEALVAIYIVTDGDNWTNNSNWGTSDVTSWFGITVGGGIVSNISLTTNNLSGNIPAEIGNLTSLQVIALAANQLTGSIPPEIGNTSIANMTLSDNQLSGSLPAELGNLTNGSLWIMADNDFTGTIPPELGNLTSLRILNLTNSELTGSIPAELANSTMLMRVQVEGNQLTGSIPAEFGAKTLLTYVETADNDMSGELPPALGNRNMSSNFSFNDNNYSCWIPQSYGGTSVAYYNNRLIEPTAAVNPDFRARMDTSTGTYNAPQLADGCVFPRMSGTYTVPITAPSNFENWRNLELTQTLPTTYTGPTGDAATGTALTVGASNATTTTSNITGTTTPDLGITYSVYDNNACTGSPAVTHTPSDDGTAQSLVDISSIANTNTEICLKVEMHSAVPLTSPQLDRWRTTYDVTVPTVAQGHQYEDAITYLVTSGLVDEGDIMTPDAWITREMFLQIMGREGYTQAELDACTPNETIPSDVPTALTKEACMVANDGLFKLDIQGKFLPDTNVNFVTAVQALGNRYNIQASETLFDTNRIQAFSDAKYIVPTIAGLGTALTIGEFSEIKRRVCNNITNSATYNESSDGLTINPVQSVSAVQRGTPEQSIINKLVVSEGITIGDKDTTCTATEEGTIRYDAANNKLQGCDGTSWNDF